MREGLRVKPSVKPPLPIPIEAVYAIAAALRAAPDLMHAAMLEQELYGSAHVRLEEDGTVVLVPRAVGCEHVGGQ